MFTHSYHFKCFWLFGYREQYIIDTCENFSMLKALCFKLYVHILCTCVFIYCRHACSYAIDMHGETFLINAFFPFKRMFYFSDNYYMPF